MSLNFRSISFLLPYLLFHLVSVETVTSTATYLSPTPTAIDTGALPANNPATERAPPKVILGCVKPPFYKPHMNPLGVESHYCLGNYKLAHLTMKDRMIFDWPLSELFRSKKDTPSNWATLKNENYCKCKIKGGAGTELELVCGEEDESYGVFRKTTKYTNWNCQDMCKCSWKLPKIEGKERGGDSYPYEREDPESTLGM